MALPSGYHHSIMLLGDERMQEFKNRLINEKSPYLLQHANNPVDWYPWGAEAFDRAKTEDKPVFLSIGYSTCHWCHVMAHESFEDTEVADILNKNFVCIKVDKEERPDIDSVYMNVCQSLTGSGGWPLTIIMTPDQKPFYAATYLPKTSRHSMVGLTELLSEVVRLWAVGRKELVLSSEEIASHAASSKPVHPSDMTKALFRLARDMFSSSFDQSDGGFGRAPKFPSPHNLMFLLRYSVLEDDKQSLEMVEKTLDSMYRGGIFDHIGGGFSRYSTDSRWLVPHFEKMLYDNALLAITYLEAYQMTQRPLYKRVAEKTLDYVLREMTDEKGGFYSAQDADSDGVEGKYYVFTPDEITAVLGQDDGEYFKNYFGLTEQGNFKGKNIINLINNPDIDRADPKIEALCKKIYDYRLSRNRLHKDDKILTSWNSLMIVAFAKAARILDRTDYERAAVMAYTFTDLYLIDQNGSLCVRFRDDHTFGRGFLDDYAFTVWALITLYETTFDEYYLYKAVEFGNKMIYKFYDADSGGFFLYDKNSETLISRPKEVYDGAIPSGNSVASYVLQRLSVYTDNRNFADLASKQLQFLAGSINNYPSGFSFALISGMRDVYPGAQVACVSKSKNDAITFRNTLAKNFTPNLTVIYKHPDSFISEVVPFTKDYTEINGRATYYLCQNHACYAPTNDLNDIENRLKDSFKKTERV